MNKRWKIGSILVLTMMLGGISSAWAVVCPPTSNKRCNKVPEIDSTGELPALALLGGVLAVINERRRRK
jgi:hypothetical protein